MEKNKKPAVPVRPIYKKLLIAAIVFYIIGSCIIHADLYYKVCRMEHKLHHIQCEH